MKQVHHPNHSHPNQNSSYLYPIETKIFGIRHHGPGSARQVLASLEAWQPDCVLIEGPEDGNDAIKHVAHADMQPPVALLVYDPKELSRASFYPFVEFSPEWQALRWALQEAATVRFIDLPVGKQFFIDENAPQQLLKGITKKFRRDPFREMAKLGGYSDSERFWEAVVERQNGAEGVFEAIAEMMRALREANEGQESHETLLREAHMREGIRTAEKDGFQRIAVVCGAWHVPALEIWQTVKKSADAKILRGLKKTKTANAWIPWSFDRLSMQSGYGAGVRAPLWYQQLFEHPTNATEHWMTLAAQTLRSEDLSASSAHVMEAVRLAHTLATLRYTSKPGIEELREAVVSVMSDGATQPMELIDRQVVIGDVIGAVPDSVPKAPLKADFEAQLKAARFKLSSSPEQMSLDLRKAAQQRKSILLHRMQLLGIDWGKIDSSAQSRLRQGSFHEDWLVHWLPDFEIKLIEMGVWGNTIEAATTLFIQTSAPYKTKLAELIHLLDKALKADLPALLPALLQKMRDMAAAASDALVMADALLPLVEVLRYGSARSMDLSAVDTLIDELVPRVCIHLPDACRDVDAEASEAIFQKILNVNRAIGLHQDKSYKQLWHDSLRQIAQSTRSAPALAGLATRLLYDMGRLTEKQVALYLSGIRTGKALEIALWMEGFLFGSGVILLLNDSFRHLLDAWVMSLDESDFEEVLPLLRRAFSQFMPPEREKLLHLLKNGNPQEREAEVLYEVELLELVGDVFGLLV